MTARIADQPVNPHDKFLDYWDREAESFDAIYSGAKPLVPRLLDRWFRRDMRHRFDWILEQAGDLRGKSVCDLGCGSGRYLAACAQRGADSVVGVDAAPNMLRLAARHLEEAGLSARGQLRQFDLLRDPFEGSFDVTLAIGFFDYLRDLLPFLQRVRRLTRSRFLATFPRRWTWRMPLRRLRLWFLGLPVCFYSADQVRSLLVQAGFRCERMETIGALFCVVAVPEGAEAPATGSHTE